MNNQKKEELRKQGDKYLSHLYSNERRPITDYPDRLAEYLYEKYLNKKGDLLDVGCGRGDMLKSFQKLNMNVRGIDISEESKEICKPIRVDNINLEDDAADEPLEEIFPHILATDVGGSRRWFRLLGVGVFVSA